mmetsp:Transcript_11208/g.33624  ORF Transcript_11208/g.33624 Transcript_11208/m.33624 type:complete len:140 (-) Transcript_11208:301-720(-)|eukprot:CAMPEP_0206139296 /NCGR_PEP_ID=MMETSP1473-20131121/5517_1 /ASSEMBLY_ACC=CAM_ASM_001109 /TAXON_ID=1461547 /ORGANISM="Stichococcus sp, Strain RCC1054" /LENGTH=139 /DNA_ID=CAMNT_0053533033 /DNA_START=189 /DNA_END=608 /DNA_ORIENTATION=+
MDQDYDADPAGHEWGVEEDPEAEEYPDQDFGDQPPADMDEDGPRESEVLTDAGQDRGLATGERVTTRFMTKYERARILGTRALQISMNAPVMVELEGETDYLVLATKELDQGKIPFTIRRYLPDGSYEDWKVSELTQFR